MCCGRRLWTLFARFSRAFSSWGRSWSWRSEFSSRVVWLRQRRGLVSIAVTFCAQTKRERCDDESGDSFFRWSEAESLPHFIESEAPDLFQLAKVLKVNSEIDSCAAAEPEPSADNAAMKGRRQSRGRESRCDVSRKRSGLQRAVVTSGR